MKINKTKYLPYALLLAIGLVGCDEDYLNTQPTKTISAEDYGKSVELNPELIDGTLNGIYSGLIDTYTGGTKHHTDFGQKGYDIYSDVLSGDMARTKNSYNKHLDLAQLIPTTDYTHLDNYRVWSYYYREIRSCNAFIDGLGGNDFTPTKDEVKYGMGQAKAIRAYAYFYLTQFFIPEYTPDSKVLPLLTDASQEAVPQSTTKEVYDQMIKDLTEAIRLLEGYQRPSKKEVDQNVAKGLLAYVYGSMNTLETNQKAKKISEDLMTKYKLMSDEEVLGGFNNINTTDWIWGFDITTDMDFDLVSWWGMMDLYTYSYQWAGDVKAIDDLLYAAIPNDDVRKKQFDSADPEDTHYLGPNGKFYHWDRKVRGQRVIEADYVFMRVAEMYLLNAEMAAKTGDEATAKSSLKALVSQRMPDASYIDSLTGVSLLNEIYFQTRIELWGEGKSYLAMKRFKADVTRGSNHMYFSGETFKYNDDKLTLKIPLSEIQNNTFINN